MRHTFASHLVMRGVPLTAVQQLLGHSTIVVTMRYAHLSPGVKNDAISMLDPVKSAPVPSVVSEGNGTTVAQRPVEAAQAA